MRSSSSSRIRRVRVRRWRGSRTAWQRRPLREGVNANRLFSHGKRNMDHLCVKENIRDFRELRRKHFSAHTLHAVPTVPGATDASLCHVPEEKLPQQGQITSARTTMNTSPVLDSRVFPYILDAQTGEKVSEN